MSKKTILKEYRLDKLINTKLFNTKKLAIEYKKSKLHNHTVKYRILNKLEIIISH